MSWVQSFISSEVMPWARLGTKEFRNGTLWVGHIPHVAPLAYMHRLYAPVYQGDIDDQQAQMHAQFPGQYSELLKSTSGINMYNGNLIVYGLITPKQMMGMLGLFSLGASRFKGDSYISYALTTHYSDARSEVIQYQGNFIAVSGKDKNTVLGEWASLEEFLYEESARLKEMHDGSGKAVRKFAKTPP